MSGNCFCDTAPTRNTAHERYGPVAPLMVFVQRERLIVRSEKELESPPRAGDRVVLLAHGEHVRSTDGIQFLESIEQEEDEMVLRSSD